MRDRIEKGVTVKVRNGMSRHMERMTKSEDENAEQMERKEKTMSEEEGLQEYVFKKGLVCKSTWNYEKTETRGKDSMLLSSWKVVVG